MDWQGIRNEIAMEHLINGHEVRCHTPKGIKYYNSVSHPNASTITLGMVRNGKWQVYTWLP